MRRFVVTACACLLTCSTSIAADQKLFNDRVGGDTQPQQAASSDATTVQAKTPALPLDPQPLDSQPAELSTGMPPFHVLADQPIAIPQQTNTAALLTPRDLPQPKSGVKQVVHRSTDEVCQTVSQAAQSNNLPAPFFIRLLYQESGFKPGIVSHAGAQGIAQFMPETAASVGLQNPFDPLQAIPAAARFLRNLVDKFGNLGLAAAAYNAGPGRIQKWLAHKSPLPNETKGYVKVITGKPAESWKGTSTTETATRLPAEAPCKDVIVASNEPYLAPEPAPTASPVKRVAKAVVAAKTRVAKTVASVKAHVAAAVSTAKTRVAAVKASAHAKPHTGSIVVAKSEVEAEKKLSKAAETKTSKVAETKTSKVATQKAPVNVATKAHHPREHRQRLASR